MRAHAGRGDARSSASPTPPRPSRRSSSAPEPRPTLSFADVAPDPRAGRRASSPEDAGVIPAGTPLLGLRPRADALDDGGDGRLRPSTSTSCFVEDLVADEDRERLWLDYVRFARAVRHAPLDRPAHLSGVPRLVRRRSLPASDRAHLTPVADATSAAATAFEIPLPRVRRSVQAPSTTCSSSAACRRQVRELYGLAWSRRPRPGEPALRCRRARDAGRSPRRPVRLGYHTDPFRLVAQLPSSRLLGRGAGAARRAASPTPSRPSERGHRPADAEQPRADVRARTGPISRHHLGSRLKIGRQSSTRLSAASGAWMCLTTQASQPSSWRCGRSSTRRSIDARACARARPGSPPPRRSGSA